VIALPLRGHRLPTDTKGGDLGFLHLAGQHIDQFLQNAAADEGTELLLSFEAVLRVNVDEP
jgi:hypothetical protein